MRNGKSLRRVAHEIGIHEVNIYKYIHGKAYASFETAVAIELATGGRYKVEDMVRPEVAEALKKLLKVRCKGGEK